MPSINGVTSSSAKTTEILLSVLRLSYNTVDFSSSGGQSTDTKDFSLEFSENTNPDIEVSLVFFATLKNVKTEDSIAGESVYFVVSGTPLTALTTDGFGGVSKTYTEAEWLSGEFSTVRVLYDGSVSDPGDFSFASSSSVTATINYVAD
jgi:hypothetical protein